MAAESYARLTGLGCAVVTSGPGGTNALTALASCWIDSQPVVFISGQVVRKDQINGDAVRQMGVQEFDIMKLVTPITKYAQSVKHADEVPAALSVAASLALSGRKGPVWLDIPLDIQAEQIDAPMRTYAGSQVDRIGDGQWRDVVKLLSEAQRPVLMLGNGCRDSRRVPELVKHLGIPVLTSWAAADMVGSHPYCFGRPGLFGSRAANFIMQNADLILAVGCRLAIPQIGYRYDLWARGAKVIMVDADLGEMSKRTLHVDMKIWADAEIFIDHALAGEVPKLPRTEWFAHCIRWEKKYPMVDDAFHGRINPFQFVEALCKVLPEDAVVVTDVGTSYTSVYQRAKMKLGQRWISAFGHAPMGWGLPGAIGAHYATGKRIYCIVGDGGLQFNLQELATIAGNQIPITLFVIDNGGYVAISHMQTNHFKRRTGSDQFDLWFPDLRQLADLYGFGYSELEHTHELKDTLQYLVDRPKYNELVRVIIPHDTRLHPRVGSFQKADGSISSRPLEDMVPYIGNEQLEHEMLIPIAEEK